MKRNQTICVTTSIKDENIQRSPGIIIKPYQDDDFSFNQTKFASNILKPWIIAGDVERKYAPIDKPLYTLINGALWEHFELKTMQKTNRLGRLYGKEFKWKENMPQNFYERRGNFENVTLIAMTTKEMSYVTLLKDWKSPVNKSQVVSDSYEVK